MPNTPIRAAQAHIAQMLKATLAAGEQWRAMQVAAGLRLLHAQFDHLDAGAPAGSALRDLADLHGLFAAGLSAQAEAVRAALERQARGGVGDLRAAQSADDVAIVCVGLFTAAGATMREAGSEMATLLNSTHAAATVLLHKGLDEMAGETTPP
jgi:hypothetical protein